MINKRQNKGGKQIKIKIHGLYCTGLMMAWKMDRKWSNLY
jgi:hypothetical protein